MLWVACDKQPVTALSAAGQSETDFSRSAQEQFVAVRGVGGSGVRRAGQTGAPGAGRAAGTHFCLVFWPSTEQERLMSSVPALAPLSEVAGGECRAVPRGCLGSPRLGPSISARGNLPCFWLYCPLCSPPPIAEASVCPGTGKRRTWNTNHTDGVIFILLSKTRLH